MSLETEATVLRYGFVARSLYQAQYRRGRVPLSDRHRQVIASQAARDWESRWPSLAHFVEPWPNGDSDPIGSERARRNRAVLCEALGIAEQ